MNTFVNSEIGQLQRLLIHSPDSGLGRVVPSKAQDWLFEDIVQLDKMRKDEYDYYVKILLYFLDREKVQGKIAVIDHKDNNRNFYKPDHKDYFKSDKVLDAQFLLSEILQTDSIRRELVASISALELLTFQLQKELLECPPVELSKVLISGFLGEKLIFPPIPNFIFTRDLGIVINNYLLMNKPAKGARVRESFIAKNIFHHHPIFNNIKDNIIELEQAPNHFLLEEEEKEDFKVTIEGGDVMMVAPNHLLIGMTERTSYQAISQVMAKLFEKKIVEKISVIKVPSRREFMHIDTVFTQIKKNTWVLFGKFGKINYLRQKNWGEQFYRPSSQKSELEILQFSLQEGPYKAKKFEFLEDLLDNISREDLKCTLQTEYIYSGDNIFPFSQREQWTDSCNVLALKEGVVIGYDRNKYTAQAFKNKGYRVISAKDLLDEFEAGISDPDTITDTLIELPSAELSRARGGSHCMSMPINRLAI